MLKHLVVAALALMLLSTAMARGLDDTKLNQGESSPVENGQDGALTRLFFTNFRWPFFPLFTVTRSTTTTTTASTASTASSSPATTVAAGGR
ncbi:unnamed protein product [Allacma fusca]|uniref:Uncharacterized protein n=1 Tax=Allacma fusca TaxID=39272 RepID=A0A8J2KJH6_9HEXA|nr:unnamed protein product [Allacma fusca]